MFALEPFGKLVKLTLTHEDFVAGSLLLDGISKGWPAILSALKSLLEKGTAIAIPPAALGIEGHRAGRLLLRPGVALADQLVEFALLLGNAFRRPLLIARA